MFRLQKDPLYSFSRLTSRGQHEKAPDPSNHYCRLVAVGYGQRTGPSLAFHWSIIPLEQRLFFPSPAVSVFPLADWPYGRALRQRFLAYWICRMRKACLLLNAVSCIAWGRGQPWQTAVLPNVTQTPHATTQGYNWRLTICLGLTLGGESLRCMV